MPSYFTFPLSKLVVVFIEAYWYSFLKDEISIKLTLIDDFLLSSPLLVSVGVKKEHLGKIIIEQPIASFAIV
jgi:hypothetical protein